MRPLRLNLSLPAWERLHEAADVRKKTIEIQREDLAMLLMDHSKCLARLEELRQAGKPK